MKIQSLKLEEFRLAERERNEGGASRCVLVVRHTEYLISRLRKRRNSSESEGTFHSFPSGYDLLAPQYGQDLEGGLKGDVSGGQNDGQRADESVSFPPTDTWPTPGPRSTLYYTSHHREKTQNQRWIEDSRARFFEDYRNEAEEYDNEFMEKYGEDLNTTLIFVSFVWYPGVRVHVRVLTWSQAGLFSAVTSAFIIEVHSHLQQDPNDETAALLRVLIHKIDNTTFGNDPPAIPQWTGPPQTIVHVQAILLASLAASLLSAFPAMLGKQWLNRYVSTDMRGTAIERSQNRQRKLDGVITWYFDHVMESLPLMLQAALLLLGCALSRYLWGINLTVASVVLAVTLFGMTFYAFIIVAGTVSESCPYQTPGARFLRYIFLTLLPSALHLARSFIHKLFIFVSQKLQYLARSSFCCGLLVGFWSSLGQPWYSPTNIAISFGFILQVPGSLIVDFCFLGPGMLLITLGRMVGHLVVALAGMAYRWYRWLITPSPKMHGLDRKTIALDVRCVSWMLQTSLDKAVHLSTMKYLATMMTLADFDPALVSGCFDVFVGCIKVDVSNHKVAIVHGLEELAAVSAMCFLRTFHQLSVMDLGSSVLKDVCKRYNRVFPTETDFRGLPFYFTITKIHALANRSWDPRYLVGQLYTIQSGMHFVHTGRS